MCCPRFLNYEIKKVCLEEKSSADLFNLDLGNRTRVHSHYGGTSNMDTIRNGIVAYQHIRVKTFVLIRHNTTWVGR